MVQGRLSLRDVTGIPGKAYQGTGLDPVSMLQGHRLQWARYAMPSQVRCIAPALVYNCHVPYHGKLRAKCNTRQEKSISDGQVEPSGNG